MNLFYLKCVFVAKHDDFLIVGTSERASPETNDAYGIAGPSTSVKLSDKFVVTNFTVFANDSV